MYSLTAVLVGISLATFCITDVLAGLQSVVVFSVDGMRGEFLLTQSSPSHNVSVRISVSLLNPAANGSYNLHVAQYPVDYTLHNYCSRLKLGKILHRLKDVGSIQLPLNQSVTRSTSTISLYGPSSVLGRTLVLRGRKTACGNIHLSSASDKDPGDDVDQEKEDSMFIYQARFLSPLAGTVMFSVFSDPNSDDIITTSVLADLQHLSSSARRAGGGGGSRTGSWSRPSPADSLHHWAIMVPDVLDEARDDEVASCDSLQLIYDPPTVAPSCGNGDCKAGNLSSHLGMVTVSGRRTRNSRQTWSSTTVRLPDLRVSARRAYLTIFSSEGGSDVVACARLRLVRWQRAMVKFSQHGVTGAAELSQRSIFSPTTITLKIDGLARAGSTFSVHQFPVPSSRHCDELGGVYDPYSWRNDDEQSPDATTASHDQYACGDLSGKHGHLSGLDSFVSSVMDFQLPLLGARSVIGRSILISLISNNNNSDNSDAPRHICATILQPDIQTVRAVAVFRYPVAGVVTFSQPSHDPAADTSVHVQHLLMSDGVMQDASSLRWYVRQLPPGEDFRNWTARCVSAGDIYNPHKVDAKSHLYYGTCTSDDMIKCELGDLTQRLGTLSIVAHRNHIAKTQRFWTDTNLPLSGPHSVIGRSVVIHDDNGPKARGDRLACVQIMREYRYKGVVNQWAYNTPPASLSGTVEFIQQSPQAPTSTHVQLAGLQERASELHVHLVPVDISKTFPCHNTVLGGVYSPHNVTPHTLVNSQDQFKVGDLSGKYGASLLDAVDTVDSVFNDTTLQLFGADSVLGRSVVVQDLTGNRWACGTIGWGYSPSEATQVTAVASFHHPDGFAWGYIKFSQLQYVTGGRSSTVLEVALRYPGESQRRVTRRHRWAVFVNPVGHDAAVTARNARCTAAGYRWNPHFIQLANPTAHDFYREQCSVDTPLRCEVGDLSGRLGPIDLGLERVVLSDPNLPLEGDFWHSAVGKSVVIFDPEYGHNKLACANIELDYDIVSRVSIRKSPKFATLEFLKSVRDALQAPEWFLFIDEQETSEIDDGRCVQFSMHFRGPQAHKLQLQLNRGLAGARVAPVSLPAGVHRHNHPSTLPYRLCRSVESPRSRTLSQGGRGSGRYPVSTLFSHATAVVAIGRRVVCCSWLLPIVIAWLLHA